MSPQENHKIIVELYGLPGAGKSTTAKRLVTDFGLVLIKADLKRYHYVTLSLKYPVTVISWSSLILKNFFKKPNLKLLTYNISLLYSSLQKMHDAARCEKSCVVDEGLAQRFLSYSDTVHKPTEILSLLKKSLHGDILVLINDREVTDSQLKISPARTQQGESYIIKWKQNLKINLEQMEGVIFDNTRFHHFETKNLPIDDIMAKIGNNSTDL